jgi:hypothetical protein
VREAIRALRGAGPVRVVVGGRALACLSDAAAKLGADAVCTSAGAGVEVARAWRPP